MYQMKNADKYQKGFFLPPEPCYDWVKKDAVDKAPIWCSVDLRDGNQALVVPMSLEEKLDFFQYLVQLGFKEIEVGFPAASETEFEFLRTLIEKDMIPDDVTIQVLTQSREHIIKRTFEALKGCKHAIVHLYNSTSVAQREQVFKKDKEAIIDIAVTGAELFNQYVKGYEDHYRFEYSPESFTGTEPEFALEICNRVIDIWKPTKERPVIINLPVTVEMSSPHVYACQVEYMSKHLHDRENVIISLHPHNDRGCAVADTELGLLAGADRVEGTLFGNGERTGNVDIVTLAMNLFSHGIDPKLDFSNMNETVTAYEKATKMPVGDRQPYAGKLVFAAFSGSHQDAIAKGMDWRKEKNLHQWTVPYLPIDPKDVGREYEKDVIRINSQSGKGGIGYLLEQKFGYHLPPKMREHFGYRVKSVSDHAHKELSADEVFSIFRKEYCHVEGAVTLADYHFRRHGEDITVDLTLEDKGVRRTATASGNGRLDAVSNAAKEILGMDYTIVAYTEHALTQSSKSQAVAYVGIEYQGTVYWGVGEHSDIIAASIFALVSAINQVRK